MTVVQVPNGRAALNAVSIWWVSGLIVLMSAFLIADFHIAPSDRDSHVGEEAIDLDRLAKWDGHAYRDIAVEGYRYNDGRRERIAFFPVYPVLARWVSRMSGMSVVGTLVVLSNGAFLLALIVLSQYVIGTPGQVTGTLLAAAFWPPSYFMRMAYTESAFLLACLLPMWLIRRRAHPAWVAVAVGLATGTRSVGVALLVPMVIYTVRRAASWRSAVGTLVAIGPLSVWGVLAFMAYQRIAYHDPLAFAKIQAVYRMRPALPWGQVAIKLVTLEPIWAAYRPTSDAFWGQMTMSEQNPGLFTSMYFWNPIYFSVAAIAVGAGCVWRVLDRYEGTLAAGLLLIPYVTRGYDFGMGSQARFTAVCFPVFIVLGRVLSALPETGRVLVVVVAALQLSAWSALFGEGYPLF